MTRRSLLLSLPLVCGAAVEKGFTPLFNGSSLDGWDGDPRLWRVENGGLVGSTDNATISGNSFLIHKKQFGDFVFRTQIKLRNHNSGIQFRSEALPDWVVKGYQADAAQDNWWGCIYDEKGKRGVMVNGWKTAQTVVKLQDWNDYEIQCKGDLIQLRLNGTQTAELRDSERMRGVIALQLHRGPAMEVRFRNIRIQEL